MQITCPHCRTIFKVSNEHLQVADGYVRCGICKEVFNALEKNQPEAQKEPLTQTELTSAAKTPIEKDIVSEDADAVEFILEQSNEVSTGEDQDKPFVDNDITEPKEENPAVEIADSDNNIQPDLFTTTSEIRKPEPEPAPASAETIKSEATEPETIPDEKIIAEISKTDPPVSEVGTKTEAVIQKESPKETDNYATNNTPEPSPVVVATTPNTTNETDDDTDNSNIDNSLFDGVQSKLIPDEYRIPELHNTYTIGQDLAWSLAILLFTASLFAEYAWFNRNELITDPQLRPLVMQFCDAVNCNTMELREPDKIEMVTRNIYTHPNVKNALMISGTLINHAEFEQAYPYILVDFSNVRGEVMASRTFGPEDYLQIKKSNLKPLLPRASIDFNMEIQDPGKNAMTYEFSFL